MKDDYEHISQVTVSPLHLSSDRLLDAELTKLQDTLHDISADWKTRISALKTAQAIALSTRTHHHR